VGETVSPSYASSSSTSIARGARPRSSPVGLLVKIIKEPRPSGCRGSRSPQRDKTNWAGARRGTNYGRLITLPSNPWGGVLELRARPKTDCINSNSREIPTARSRSGPNRTAKRLVFVEEEDQN
jgi:hypothetical protein